jgi:hypothetical protein
VNNKYTVQPFNFSFNCQIAELMVQRPLGVCGGMVLTTVKGFLTVLWIIHLCLNFFTSNREYMLQPKSLFYSFLTAFQLVFSKPTYIAIAGLISNPFK